MIRTFSTAALAACLIAACTSPYNFAESPDKWTPETYAHFSRQSGSVKCAMLRNSSSKGLSPTARQVVMKEYKSLGLNKRDLEILSDPDATYGTGMTFPGLECAAGRPLSINDSFYSGSGHHWQVPFGSGYVYLRGDGTKSGMTVHSWN